LIFKSFSYKKGLLAANKTVYYGNNRKRMEFSNKILLNSVPLNNLRYKLVDGTLPCTKNLVDGAVGLKCMLG
jgi:hypothetical protein